MEAKTYHFKGILTNEGWLENGSVTVDSHGIITSLSSVESGECVDGFALPGFQNAHSHAFQYAMAGLAELHVGENAADNFWSWRNAMYSLALTISPDQMEAIATMLYAEMLRQGYTAVAEFHYLHHDKNGQSYNNIAEMGERLMAAAQNAGINLTLVPMFYQKGGFGQEPGDSQKRFISKDIESYYRLLEKTQQIAPKYKPKTGVGIHSLRAVKSEDIVQVCKDLDGSLPFHIHISEQLKEIEDCVAYHGKRPVQWLLDHCNVNENYHLVHATHLDDIEVANMARSGANVVICPSTEGNLGDGLFRFADYKAHGGRWSIGTDSHVGLNPFEELRILDYGQRLITHDRNTFFLKDNGDSGFNAIKMSFESGRAAMGEKSVDFFAVGQYFNAVVMNGQSLLTATSSLRNLCNTFVYASDVSNILGTIANGKWVIKDGIHLNHEVIFNNFKKVMTALGNRY